MSKIENARGRDPETGPSGYERLFGNAKLGFLLSRCQATVISSGNELERILAGKVTNPQGLSISKLNKEKRTFRDVKTDSRGKKHGISIDVVIERNSKIKLIELKDGDVFDVKKVAGEVESLRLVKEFVIDTGKYDEEEISIHFCSFNQENKQHIYRGAKGLLPEDAAMTGRELCNDLGIDYDQIIEERKLQQPDNLRYFVKELMKIPEVVKEIKTIANTEQASIGEYD